MCIYVFIFMHLYLDFPGGSGVKNLLANAGDTGSILGSGRSLGEGNGNPLQYSCGGNTMDKGAYWATVHGVTKSGTRLSGHACTHHCLSSWPWWDMAHMQVPTWQEENTFMERRRKLGGLSSKQNMAFHCVLSRKEAGFLSCWLCYPYRAWKFSQPYLTEISVY